MSDITEYRPGTPCWVELWTPDRPAAMDFYRTVFGWEYDVAPEEQHFFTIAKVRGLRAAGIITPPGNPSAPTVWFVYLATDDLDTAIARISSHGGQLLTGAITVPGEDDVRIALAMDPVGGMFGVWQAKGGRGADVANEPGTFIWNELITPAPAAAREFYVGVFGVGIGEVAEGFDYSSISVGGEPVGGIGLAQEGAPSLWGTYFNVSSVDATVEQVRSAGGSVIVSPTDAPYGRMATCADPKGAVFSLMSAAAGS